MASRSPKAAQPKSALKKSSKQFIYENDFFDRFYKKGKPCTIPATNKKVKKDVFSSMRPAEGIYADYDISQTDIKMDAGPAKIHLERTVAEYTPPPPGVDITPPPPPKKKKIKHSHGGPPVWEFIDEKRMKKIEQLQEVYKERLTELIARHKKAAIAKRLALHNYLLKLAGPEWYQELSPRQIETVNQLKDCITKDLATKTTINVFENLGELGLVPRPCRRRIAAALQICCACPVDFILILYQMTNPNRQSYSINDRLLLSAVVHLTMTETLRELHIRIPSPPPQPPPPKPAKKKPPKKKKTYKSPYLIPFTFKPDPPKYSGIYKDNHKQYPESPYFSYIAELKKTMEYEDEKENDGCSTSVEYGHVDYEGGGEDVEVEENQEFERAAAEVEGASLEVNLSDDSLLKVEQEIAKELIVAQREYNKLSTYRPIPRLYKPSVYIPCKQGQLTKKIEEVVEIEEETPPSQHDINVAVEVKLTTKYDENTGKMVKKICECTVKFRDKRQQEGDSSFALDEPPRIEEIMPVRNTGDAVNEDGGEGEEQEERVYRPLEPICLPELPKLDAGKNVTLTKKPSPLCKCKYRIRKELKSKFCKCEKCQELKMQQPPTFIIAGQKQAEDEEVVPIIAGVKLDTCFCLAKYRERIKKYEEYKRRHDMVEQMKALSQKYVIGGVCIGREGKPTFMLSGVKPKCRCGMVKEEEEEKEHLLAVKDIASSSCVCKPEVQKGIDTTVCRCKRCVELAHARFKHDLMISGLRAAEGEAAQKIIEGVKAHKTECDCLRKYRESIQQYESWKTRNRAVEELKSVEQKFVIGGVVNRPNQPPVFIISGTEPRMECPCVQRRREEAAERERLRKMPKKLLGLEYMISGVKETPDGNVFIISGVKEGKKCKCLHLYDKFMKKHKKCIKISELYDEKTKEDMEEYMSDFPEEEKLEEEEEEERGENEEVEQRVVGYDVEKENVADVDECGCDEAPEEKVEIIDTNLVVTLEINRGEDKDKEGGTCVCDEEEEKVEEEVELKRFIILDKFPQSTKTQYKILKQALSVMAEDGYPLAKLPDCHKLPHFKLWLQLRSGKSWSLEEKYEFIKKFNKPYWNHTNNCFGRVSAGLVDIDPKMHRNFSYANVKAVKRMVATKRGYFYRVLKQSSINDGREFIPTMNIYEFPFSTFRDCLFAYVPPKEEAVFSFRPWFAHEFKNMKDQSPC